MAVEKTASRATVAALAGPPSSTARLVVVYPPEAVAVHTIPRTTVTVGRHGFAGGPALVIDHPTVSRRHLTIHWEPALGRHAISDPGSRNGSALNGHEVTASPLLLADNHVVRMGDVLAVFEHIEGPPVDASEVARAALPGDAARVQALRHSIAHAAPDPAPALLLGETGTGKERIAAELHRLSGRRGPFIPVNCAALSPQLVESQLFGHERGSFTGATATYAGLFRAADGGTLFLDEVGELPRDLQPKLLRAIEYGEVSTVGATRAARVDVRIVAATNRMLAEEVKRGEFRRDLLARLSLWELHIPPLRERRADLLAWIERLHTAWRARRGRPDAPPPRLSPEIAEALLLYDWPDNLRELDRLLHGWGPLESRCASDGDTITRLPAWLRAGPTTAAPGPLPRSQRVARARPSRDVLVAALAANHWSVRATARQLARDRKQVSRWIAVYGIELLPRAGDST